MGRSWIMNKPKPINLIELRRLRRINDITLEEVRVETGISVGYLSLIERGIRLDIDNDKKRKKLESFIKKLRRRKPKLF